MTYTGRCNCGAVTLTIEAEPIATRQCWCRQCQKIAAGGPTQNALFPTDTLTLNGATAHTSYTAASGNTLTHEFCPSCGTHVYAYSSARPHLRTVRIGLLDEGHGLRPTVAIWLDDAPEWAFLDPKLERWQQQPPAPASAAKS